MENDCQLADIILPANTVFEEDDISYDGLSGQYLVVFPEYKCIEPIGESMSDYEIVCAIAKRLGVYKEYTGGKSVDEWIKESFDHSRIQKLISWDQFREKGYFVVPTSPDWKEDPPGLRNFYDNPLDNPLKTPTGKLEFESVGLKEHFPDDIERPPVPHWIPYGESHQESLQHPRSKKYPLLILTNHPRWAVHANHEDIDWLREIPTCKVRGSDSYQYQPIWINPRDAAARDIKNGDIVKIFNERGIVLGGAYVTERVMSGAVSMDHGAKYDPIVPGEIDRGGAINAITPRNTTSKNACGMAVSGFLVEVQKVTEQQMKEWEKSYPAAFERINHPDAGPGLEAWVDGVI
jgi:anaerobic selenocysteine-containing dehydrogenase